MAVRKEGLNTFQPEVKVALLERKQTKILNAVSTEVRMSYEQPDPCMGRSQNTTSSSSQCSQAKVTYGAKSSRPDRTK